MIAGTDLPGSEAQPVISRPSPTEAELRRLYLEQNQTVDQIAAVFGYSDTKIAGLMDHYEIPRRPRGYFRTKLGDDTVAEILNRYRAGGTIPRIAEELHLKRSEVRQQVDEAGITRPRRPVAATDITDQQLRDEYECGASVMDLVENHDLTRNSVADALARAGTEMRPTHTVKGRAAIHTDR